MEGKSNGEEYLTPDDFKGEESGQGLKAKFNAFLESPWWFITIIALVGFCAFLVGKITSMQSQKPEVKIIYPDSEAVSNNEKPATVGQEAAVGTNFNTGGEVVGSKNSNKYHYPWCAGAKQIAEKNKLTWHSVEEARAAGYLPAGNCKGLK